MNFIEKKYNCELHGEVDYTARLVWGVVHQDGHCEKWDDVDKTEPYCPTCANEKRQKKEEEKRINEQKRSVERDRLTRHSNLGLPKRFKNCTFESYIPTCETAEKNLAICKQYVSNFDSVLEAGKGLIMIGKVGTGKTHLACSIGYQLAEDGYWPHYNTVSEMVRRVRATWSRNLTRYDSYSDCHVKLSEQDVINDYVELDLLLIDEIGVQSGTENERNIIFTIIDERYQAMKPTIIISNFTEKELAPLISERSIDRIKQGSGTMTFDWSSYRTKAA